jgi:hypothetical protein
MVFKDLSWYTVQSVPTAANLVTGIGTVHENRGDSCIHDASQAEGQRKGESERRRRHCDCGGISKLLCEVLCIHVLLQPYLISSYMC